MLIVHYKSKKEMRENIGKRLKYEETSWHGEEYVDNGSFVASNRPQITGRGGREFFAKIVMKNGLISKVE